MNRSPKKIGKAMAICQNINSDKYTDEQKAAAIYYVMTMPTHNSFTKAKLLELLNWLWHSAYEWVDSEEVEE